jgi:hemerythrin-like domain-containing protein
VPAPLLARERWPAHPRFPQQTLLLDAHEAFRKRAVWILDRVVAIAPAGTAPLHRRQRWRLRMADDFAWWMKGMRGHERYEERRLYPFLARRYEHSFAGLEAAHRGLHERERAVIDAFAALLPGALDEGERHAELLTALRAYEDALRVHLAAEEDLIIPMLLALDPSEFTAFRSGAAEPPALAPAADPPAE